MSMGAPLYALIAAIKRSPIVVRLSERLLLARDWATVRKSADVDAYVLAWIASHVRGRSAAHVHVNLPCLQLDQRDGRAAPARLASFG